MGTWGRGASVGRVIISRAMRKDHIVGAFLALVLLGSAAAWAEVPYPSCQQAGCSDPKDFASYLFRRPGELPNDFDPSSSSNWKYKPIIGMNVLAAWRVSTGRPDVVVAVLDSGIRWNRADLARKVALNIGELPVPKGCASHDCNGDGVVNVEDYRGVADHNGNGILDAQDLLKEYSDGVDDDGNGYVDDIAGWDFFQDDNDPDDDVDFGHGTGEADDWLRRGQQRRRDPGVRAERHVRSAAGGRQFRRGRHRLRSGRGLRGGLGGIASSPRRSAL